MVELLLGVSGSTSGSTPEARLIVAGSREPDVRGDGALPAALAALRDPDALVRLAREHRVEAFVARNGAEAGLRRYPTVRAALHVAEQERSRDLALLRAELRRVVSASAEAGIPVIVLKGPVLAQTIYPDPALRPYDDLDLTIREPDEAAFVDLLHKLGYYERPSEPEVARQAGAAHVHEGAHFHRVFVQSQSGVVVELHTDPYQLGLKSSVDFQRWQRAMPFDGLPGALMLSPEDQLIQLSTHALKHGFSRLIWLKDLDYFVRVLGGQLDWGLLDRIARREGLRPAVWYALLLAEQILGAPVPPAALRCLTPDLLTRALYRWMWPRARIEALAGFSRRRAVQFYAAESWRGMLPSLVLMGRRRDRLRAMFRAFFHR